MGMNLWYWILTRWYRRELIARIDSVRRQPPSSRWSGICRGVNLRGNSPLLREEQAIMFFRYLAYKSGVLVGDTPLWLGGWPLEGSLWEGEEGKKRQEALRLMSNYLKKL